MNEWLLLKLTLDNLFVVGLVKMLAEECLDFDKILMQAIHY